MLKPLRGEGYGLNLIGLVVEVKEFYLKKKK